MHKGAEGESRLHQSEEDYRTIFELAGVGVAQADPVVGRLLHVNPKFCEITGYSEEELLGGMTVLELTHPDDREEDFEGFQKMVCGEMPEQLAEKRYVRKGGQIVWVSVNATVVRDEADQPLRTVAVIQNVTERKQAEEALRSSHKELADLRFAIDESAIVAFTDQRGRITYVNDKFCEISKYSREELIGQDHRIINSGYHPAEYIRNLWRTIAQGRVWRGELRNRAKDSSIYWVDTTIVPFLNERGNPYQYVAIRHDITERKRTEEALQYQLDLTRTIANNAADSLFLWDAEGRVTFMNPAAEQTFGWRQEELLGEALHDKMHHHYPDGRPYPICECPLVRVFESGQTLRDHEDLFFRKDGSPVNVACSLAPIVVDGKITGLILVVRDITERKKNEKDLARRASQQAAVAELGMRALAEDDLQHVMNEAVTLVVRALEVEYCKLLELLPDGEELLLRTGVGWKEGLIGKTTVEAGLGSHAGYTLLSDEPVIVEDLRNETRFSGPTLLHEHGVVSGMSTIIQGRAAPFGVLGAHTTSRRTFTQDDVNFLQAVANVVATAIERKQAEEKLGEVREAERRRIARDLHDEALQDLSYALAEAQLVQTISEDPQLGHRLERLAGTLKRVGQGLRGAIYDLRLEERDQEQDFLELLEALVELNRQRSPNVHIELFVEVDSASLLTRTKELELLRIVREALTNARRHSRASHVRVVAGASKGKLWVEVSDDGQGFDPKEATTGMGTKGMRERARAFGGELKIISKPGEGTRVRFELDLERDSKEPREEVRILLVEDHASFRQGVAAILEQEPSFSVVGQAGSLAEARQILEGVDVAIVDLGLPDGYGGELIKELRALNPQAQALVLSASLERSEIARAVECGAAGVLHKSAGMDEIAEAVQRLKEGETLLPIEEVVELLRLAGSRREEEYEATRAITRLTVREKEVLQALAEGLDSKGIAERLHISVETERNHMQRILAKLGVHSRLQALLFALRHGVAEIQ